MDKPDYSYRIFIATTPKKLWEALTSGDVLEKYWYGRRFRCSWKVGSPMQTVTPEGKVDWEGKVLKYNAPKSLSYTFQILGFQKRPSRLVFDLEAFGPVVMLTLSQYKIEKRCMQAFEEAWPAFFSTLKSLLETGKPLKLPE